MSENVRKSDDSVSKSKTQCLIAYIKPHKNRRFDIVEESDIICPNYAIAWEPEWCYLKNTFPQIKCVVLIMDDPVFLNANFDQITEHYTIAGYYKSNRFPHVDVDNSPPLGDVDVNKIVHNLKDCFCSTSCRHVSFPLLKYRNDVELEPNSIDITEEMIENLETILEIIINELAIEQARAELRKASELNEYLKKSISSMIIQLEAIVDALNDFDKNFYYYAKTVIQYYYSEAKANILKLLLKLRLMEIDAKAEDDIEETKVDGSGKVETKSEEDSVIVINKNEDAGSIMDLNKNEECDAANTTSDNEPNDPLIGQNFNAEDESEKATNNCEKESLAIEISDSRVNDLLTADNAEEKGESSIINDADEHARSAITENAAMPQDNSVINDENLKIEKQLKDTAVPNISSESNKTKRTYVRFIKRPLSETESSDVDDDEEDEEEEVEENDVVTIGDNGCTKIPRSLYDTFKDKKYTAITRSLLKQLFTRETLATSSMTGKMSPAFLNSDKKPRKRLNPTIVQDIVKFVTTHCNVLPSNVRAVITTKCADEYKMKKQREKKNGKVRKYSE